MSAANPDAVFEAHLEGMDCGERPCETCDPDTPFAEHIDYRALLVKYIGHVGREEGVTFIRTTRTMCDGGDCGFTPEELAALVECEEAAE